MKHRGKVISRFDTVMINTPTFCVSQAGRKRAIDSNARNVHAYIVSDSKAFIIGSWQVPDQNELIEVKYNPFKSEQFTIDGKAIYAASIVFLINGRAYVPKLLKNS